MITKKGLRKITKKNGTITYHPWIYSGTPHEGKFYFKEIKTNVIGITGKILSTEICNSNYANSMGWTDEKVATTMLSILVDRYNEEEKQREGETMILVEDIIIE